MHAPRDDGTGRGKMLPSRWDEITGAGGVVMLPDPGPLGYVVGLWTGMGRVSATGFGPAPLAFAEIAAFARIEGLDARECRLIRAMSAAYLAGRDAGEDVFADPEWEVADVS